MARRPTRAERCPFPFAKADRCAAIERFCADFEALMSEIERV